MLATVVAATLVGCSADMDRSDPVVARAFDRTLHWSDLRRMIPLDATPEDSASMATDLINSWLREQVVLHQAELNLDPTSSDIEEQLEDYRNSLLIFAYERALVEQKLDTAVPPPDIEAYFNEHAANFKLTDNIIRARWFKVRETDRRILDRLGKQFQSRDEDTFHELELWLAERGIPLRDTGNDWIRLADLRREVPISDAQATGQDGHLTLKDSIATYFVHVLEVRPTAAQAPLQLVADDIRSILVNQRKVRLLEQMRAQLFEEARKKKDVEIR